MYYKCKISYLINVIIIIILIIISFLLFYNNNIYSHINIFILYIKSQLEFRQVDNYFKFCINLSLQSKKYIKKKMPKISIISPVYNRQRYIKRFLKSIQNQNFIDFELILVDDCSIDNSVKIIEEYQKNDVRIIIIKNKINKGTFISRNLGVLFSKGKYVILPDPDDLLFKNIINICYKLAEKYHFEFIRFNQYIGNKRIKLYEMIKNIRNKPLYQPEISYNIFYGLNELEIIDYYINNKFIKKEVYVNALNSLKKFYFNSYIICFEDQLINYMIYKKSKTFYYMRKIGYYFFKNSMSITKNEFKILKIEIKFIFIYLQFIFEYTKNNKFEKDMANLLFSNLNKDFNFEKMLSLITIKEDLNFYYKVLKLYIDCKLINKDNKFIIKKLNNLLIKKLDKYNRKK